MSIRTIMLIDRYVGCIFSICINSGKLDTKNSIEVTRLTISSNAFLSVLIIRVHYKSLCTRVL